METVVGRLIEDFEAGRLTRRQLIHTLALCITAPCAVAPAVAQSMPAGPPAGVPAPWKTVSLDHISYAVSDYRKSTDFYRHLMGWEVVSDDGANATLRIGSVGRIIIRNSRRTEGALPRTPVATSPGQSRPPLTGVINHVSYGIAPWNTEAVKSELERRGLSPRPDMGPGDFKSFHVFDPDGWDLQISNKTRDAG